nr:protein melted-like [Procambarus clarkii]
MGHVQLHAQVLLLLADLVTNDLCTCSHLASVVHFLSLLELQSVWLLENAGSLGVIPLAGVIVSAALEDTPVIEGQLKEKKSKWKIFRKWRTRYFTLSGAHLSYRGAGTEQDKLEEKGGIDVHQIRSVKVNRGGSRHIPKAFEIFTDNKSFVLKAKDSSNAEEWIRCLSIVVAHSHAREEQSHGLLKTTTSIPRSFMYGYHSSNMRTAV